MQRQFTDQIRRTKMYIIYIHIYILKKRKEKKEKKKKEKGRNSKKYISE